ncbi:hypothetical protein [Sorangium sp. So ce861]|uniref:hypothetical protein n=1 Tax=Sorangium sp. So ce861 TaxID=3133323 RepID=UPI003F6021B7
MLRNSPSLLPPAQSRWQAAQQRQVQAAEYWYAGTDKMKDYAPFPVSRGAASTGDEEQGEAFAEAGDASEDAADDDAPEEGGPEVGEPGEDER